MIRVVIASLAALVALVAAGTGQAHPGNIWFQSKTSIQAIIEGKWKVSRARCIEPPHHTGPYTGHEMTNDYGVVKYDHFACIITSEKSGRVCAVFAHVTGQRWYDTVLTTVVMKDVRGCTSRDLGTRPGYLYE